MLEMPVVLLKEGMVPARTICTNQGTVLIAKGIPLKQSYIDRLLKFQIKTITINEPQDNEAAPVVSPSVQAVVNAGKEWLIVMKSLGIGNFHKTELQVEQVLYSFLDNPALGGYLTAMEQNKPIYEHSLRTAMLTIQIGLSNGYDFLNLQFAATAALLHDCGVDGSYTEEDDHTLFGFLKLHKDKEIDLLIALVCLQHHEHYDGHGRPMGFVRGQITEFARMISVADFLDRSIFMDKNTLRSSFVQMQALRGSRFDPGMVDCLGTALMP